MTKSTPGIRLRLRYGVTMLRLGALEKNTFVTIDLDLSGQPHQEQVLRVNLPIGELDLILILRRIEVVVDC